MRECAGPQEWLYAYSYGAVFSGDQPYRVEQTNILRGLIEWFWHDLQHHFIIPMARRQLWSAIRRLRENIEAKAEGDEKVELALPIEHLAPLQAALCPLERGAMLQSVLVSVRFYKDLAPSLARVHGSAYPATLAHMMSQRLEQLSQSGLSEDRKRQEV